MTDLDSSPVADSAASPSGYTSARSAGPGRLSIGRASGALCSSTGITLYLHEHSAPSTWDLHLIVGYDGSASASRALDAAAVLLQGRPGRIHVVYATHIPGVDMLTADAVSEIETTFDEIEQELRTATGARLRDCQDGWEFERRPGMTAHQLIAVAMSCPAFFGQEIFS